MHTDSPTAIRFLPSGAETFAAMLEAIHRARRAVDLSVYSLSWDATGRRFVRALSDAAQRGAAVHVRVDAWGSARSVGRLEARLREAGCEFGTHNPLKQALVGALDRDHRKILVADDVSFLGGINIGDEFVGQGVRDPWLDVALQVRGPDSDRLRAAARGGQEQLALGPHADAYLSGPGGGWALHRRYVRAVDEARHSVRLVHGYFLPHRAFLRAVLRAARRGVHVEALLSGRSDVPLATFACRRLHRRLLRAGVEVREWTRSNHHAKLCTVDGRRLLVGSFNLDPLSLVNREALVDTVDRGAVDAAERWAQARFEEASPVAPLGASAWRRRVVEPVGGFMHRMAERGAKLVLRAQTAATDPHASRLLMDAAWTP